MDLRRPRIVFLHQIGRRGGASTMLANIVAILNRRFECIIVCPAGEVVQQFIAAGGTVISAPFPVAQFTHISGYARPALHPGFLRDAVNVWSVQRLWARLLAELKPDIIHLNAVTLLPYLKAARSSGVKTVCLVQETAAPGFLGLRTHLLRRALKKADLVLTISQHDKEAWMPKDAESAHSIPNWIDMKEFDRNLSRSESRSKWHIPNDAFVLLFMGGISKLKGTKVLLEAFSRVSDLKEVILIIAGYSDAVTNRTASSRQTYIDEVRELLNAEAIKHRVKLVGLVSEVASLYAASDAVVFPATEAHQSRPLIEAGAMMKPVIISEFSQLREFCESGENCLAVPPGDVSALEQAIRRIVVDSALRQKVAENNYDRICLKHTKDVAENLLIRLYSQLSQP